MLIFQKKFDIFSVKHPFYFLFIALAVVVSFFVILADEFKFYKSDLEIIFIPKSVSAVAQTDFTSSNLALLPKNLSFYEKMLRDNPRLKDNLEGFFDDDKKRAWNKIISVTSRERSTIIAIEINTLNTEEAKQFSRQVAYTLFDQYAQYYSAKDDIVFRITEGPIVKVQYRWLALSLTSLFLGLLFSAVIYFFIFKLILSRAENFSKQKLVSKFSSKFFLNKDDVEGSPAFLKKIITERNQKLFTKEELTFAKRDFSSVSNNLPIISSPPVNLPVAPDGIFSTGEDKVKKDDIIMEDRAKEEMGNKNGEPSAEDYKRRLNQLLKGEL